MIPGYEICITWDYMEILGIRILIPGRIRCAQVLLSPLKLLRGLRRDAAAALVRGRRADVAQLGRH